MNVSLQQLLDLFSGEAQITGRLFRHLTDAALGQRVTPKDRSLGEMAWHIVEAIPGILTQVGLQLPALPPQDQVARSAVSLVQAYETIAREAVEAMKGSWSDRSLEEEHEVYGFRWTKWQTVMALLFHQTHHRGAMTVLMRQAGLTLPEIYGPSRDSHGHP
ncbi:MAG: DinB family protein [Thermoanaerobaculum sp.]|nr:DinB family protein [Thermoanaerobaculum sp.]MDW7967807.1 DinB family protein [Thermoanaerobaculum sp.]